MTEEFEPSISVKATTRGINQVTKKLSSEVLMARVRESLQEALNELKGLVVKNLEPLYDTGDTAGNIFTAINGTSLTDLNGIVASPDPHFAVLEFGRTAGARMPPAAPIEEWMDRHGIDPAASFVIRRAIGVRGLPAHHIMQRALDEGRKHFGTVWFKRILNGWGRGQGSTDA